MKHSQHRKQKGKPVGLTKSYRPTLPRDYSWRVLDGLTKDLSQFLNESENAEIRSVLRSRNVDRIKQLSEAWGPLCMTSAGTSPLMKIRAKYQLAALLKKFEFPGSDSAREAAAIKIFQKAEAKCAAVNHRGFPRKIQNEEFDLTIWTHARDFIRAVVGETLPAFSELSDRARHGPGVNLDTKEGYKTVFDKYRSYPYSCTEASVPLAKLLIQSDERWFDSLLQAFTSKQGGTFTPCKDGKGAEVVGETPFNWEHFWSSVLTIVPGNRITFVPKDAWKKRSIAIEPCINLMLQLGIDGFIRRKLKRFGVNLDDQSKNQRLARLGSVDGSYATIDLSAASDSVSLAIVRWLLPEEWVDLLMKVRSPQGEMAGKSIVYEKISSMGNGCTFAIESLIFASLVWGVMKAANPLRKISHSDFAVFGDDLIIRSEYVSSLISILRKSGFDINEEKSFTTGSFRESCGADWYLGHNVRPVFLTGQPKDIKDVMCDFNRLSRYLRLWFGPNDYVVLDRIHRWIPTSFHDVQGPYSDEEFDTYIHVDQPRLSRDFNGSFRFTRLIKLQKQRSEKDLPPEMERWLFLRLAHDLRPFRPEQWSKDGLSSAQGRFVIHAKGEYYSRSPATTFVWRSEYEDVIGNNNPINL